MDVRWVLMSIEFLRILLFRLHLSYFLFRLRRYIKHPRQCFIGYRHPSNSVKNITLHVLFLPLFSVFGYPDETLSIVFDILLDFAFDFYV